MKRILIEEKDFKAFKELAKQKGLNDEKLFTMMLNEFIGNRIEEFEKDKSKEMNNLIDEFWNV